MIGRDGGAADGTGVGVDGVADERGAGDGAGADADAALRERGDADVADGVDVDVLPGNDQAADVAAGLEGDIAADDAGVFASMLRTALRSIFAESFSGR